MHRLLHPLRCVDSKGQSLWIPSNLYQVFIQCPDMKDQGLYHSVIGKWYQLVKSIAKLATHTQGCAPRERFASSVEAKLDIFNVDFVLVIYVGTVGQESHLDRIERDLELFRQLIEIIFDSIELSCAFLVSPEALLVSNMNSTTRLPLIKFETFSSS